MAGWLSGVELIVAGGGAGGGASRRLLSVSIQSSISSVSIINTSISTAALARSHLALFALNMRHGGHVCQTTQLTHLVHRHGDAGRGQAHREEGVGHDHKRKV